MSRLCCQVSAALLLTLVPQCCRSFLLSPRGLRCSAICGQQRSITTSRRSHVISMKADGERAELAVGRGTFLKSVIGTAVAVATVAVTPKEAPASSVAGVPIPFSSDGAPPEQEKIAQVAGYSQFVNKLQQDLRAGALKGGVEDSAVVSRVLEKYLEPMQENMVGVAPLMELAGRDTRERARLLPLLMKVRDPDGKTRAIVGHLMELKMACGTKNAKEQLQEVEEVKETLDEFITLAKTRYDVTFPEAKGAPEGDQLGIFGCNFYGMKRTDGTNTCQPDP